MVSSSIKDTKTLILKNSEVVLNMASNDSSQVADAASFQNYILFHQECCGARVSSIQKPQGFHALFMKPKSIHGEFLAARILMSGTSCISRSSYSFGPMFGGDKCTINTHAKL